MTGLESIAANTGAIKVVAEKSESLIKSLFGKAFDEVGEIIADQVKLRRFKNQISIFEKAQKFLKEKNFDPQKVNLKVLAPLVEFSSYEEDENLQERWAKLIANILSRPSSIVIQQNAIEILNRISNEEATLLDKIYHTLQFERNKRAQNQPTHSLFPNDIKKPADYHVNLFSFNVNDLSKKLNISNDEIETQISNLIALGTVKYETQIDVSNAQKSNSDPDDMELDIDLDVNDYENIKLTKLGLAFVELCTD